MSGTVRFSVSLGEELLQQFDREWQADGLPTRSEAVKGLIRQSLVQKEWQAGKVVAGAIVLVYNHHEHSLTQHLISAQHDFEAIIVSTTHVHLDHDNCLECVIVNGKAEKVAELVKRLKAIKGIKHIELTMTTTGKNIE
jgi:CopG family nickel-responsive transcriptional regulator